ncbi:MAG: hypothetical protein IJF87_07200 [Erysipelotrichaceae bacterium]|jgi:hypothetical protein|nr:hypothetical protein [Erysipelotrichaceae bacterium]
MVKKLSWKDKYSLSLSESLVIKGIEMLLDCGQPQATTIRNETIEYCKKNNIMLIGNRVPTDVVLQLVGKSRDYFYQRMLDENRLKNDYDRA